MSFHLAERTDDLIARGADEAAARHEARRRFGNYARQKETTRDVDIFVRVDTLLADVRYAFRGLRKSPVFALVAILSLALGIGANTAIFTLINTVMLESLPVNRPGELFDVALQVGREKGRGLTPALWEEIRNRQEVFSSAFSYGSTGASLSATGDASSVSIGAISGDFFKTLGVRPAVGRMIASADDYRGCPAVAVITHAFWGKEYGSRPDVVGRSLSLDGAPFQIIGVADPSFVGIEIGYTVPVWVPLCTQAIIRAASGGTRGNFGVGWIVGRAKPGITLDQMRRHFAAVGPAMLGATVPPGASAVAAAEYRESTFRVTPFAKGIPELGASYGEALLVLMAVVAVVLLIACANVANLLLARAADRQREVAVRLAIGASRGRLVRQLLTESILLALLGAPFGVLFAVWGSRALAAFFWTTQTAAALDLSPDLTVLGFAIAIATATGMLFGLAPAWRTRRIAPQAAMRASGRGIAEGHSRFGVGKALVVGQLTLSLVAITAAGLLLSSWRRLDAIDPGFRRENVLIVSAGVRAAGLSSEQRARTFRRITERLHAIPGVTAASQSTLTPFGSANSRISVDVEGFTPASERDAFARVNVVSPGYFATIGTRLLAGRDFDGGDTPTSQYVAIVSEEFARKFYRGAPAVGRQFRVQIRNGLGAPIEIIGVAANTKEGSMREASQPIVYYAESRDTQAGIGIQFALRAEQSALALVAGVKAVIAEIEPRTSLTFTTLEAQIDKSLRGPRTIALLSGCFGALALLLTSIGLYGIMSYTVARRRNEIGVRIALGAAQARIMRMVLGETARLVAIGVVIGVALALGGSRLVRTLLYGVQPNDPMTLTLSALTLVGVALGAAMIPAMRAARADPVAALREE